MRLFTLVSETYTNQIADTSRLLRIRVQFLIEVLKDLTDSNKVEVHDDHEMSFFSLDDAMGFNKKKIVQI